VRTKEDILFNLIQVLWLNKLFRGGTVGKQSTIIHEEDDPDSSWQVISSINAYDQKTKNCNRGDFYVTILEAQSDS